MAQRSARVGAEAEARKSALAASAAGYLRRSTDRQEQSIPDQKRAIERWADEHGVVVERWYTDDAISGTSSVKRPGFQKLIAEAQARPASFSMVLVYDVKRFGRVDNDEAGYYRHLLRQAGVEVVYVSEGFLGGESDDLLRPVKQWQARQESKDLSKVTIRGLLSRVEGGWWMGGVPPHGYDLRYENERGEFLFVLRHMPDGSKRVLGENGKLVRTLSRGESISVSKRDRARLVLGEPSRVAAVRRIFALSAKENRGLKAIADRLNIEKIPTPRGPAWARIYSGQWNSSTVRAILLNPLYAGDMVWNRRTDARFHSISEQRAVERRQAHGARLVPNQESDWIVVRDSHPALISRAVAEKAKAASQERKSGQDQPVRPVGGWTGARSRFALSGLVRCGVCGARYQGVTRRKGRPRRDGTLVRTYSYACGAYISKGTSACSYNPVGQEILETAVIDAVLEFYRCYDGEEGRKLLTQRAREALGVEAQDIAESTRRVESERKRIEATIANLLDNITASTRDLAERRLGELRRERESLEVRGEELQRLAGEQGKVQELVHEVARFLDGLEFALRSGLPQERMTALRRCVEGVVADHDARRMVSKIHWIPMGDGLALQAQHTSTLPLHASAQP